MTENDRTGHSGSRWEPAAASPAADPLADQPPPGGTPGELPPPPSAAAEQASPTFAEPAPTTPARRPRGRAGLAAAAVGLVLAGGVGGFALGNATGADGRTQPGPAGTGVPGGHGDHDGFPGGRPDVGGGPGVPPDLGDGSGSATDDQSNVQS